MSDMFGGWSETTDANEETQQICNQVKDKVEDKTKKKYEEFRAVVYRGQLVNGKNFVIKVHVGGDDYLHLKVFQAFVNENKVELYGVLTNMRKDTPIIPF